MSIDAQQLTCVCSTYTDRRWHYTHIDDIQRISKSVNCVVKNGAIYLCFPSLDRHFVITEIPRLRGVWVVSFASGKAFSGIVPANRIPLSNRIVVILQKCLSERSIAYTNDIC